MGKFEELGKIGTKMVKFKQEKLIEVLKEQNKITLEQYDEIKGGACTAICMAWIKSKFHPDSILGFHRAEHVKAAADLISQTTVQAATPRQINYVQVFHEYGEENSIRYLAREENLKFEGLLLESNDFFDIIDRCQQKLSKGEAAIVCADIADSKTGHAVALHKPDFNDLSFFDPNAGEYLVPPYNRDSFLHEYKEILRREKWVYTLTTAYQIAP